MNILKLIGKQSIVVNMENNISVYFPVMDEYYSLYIFEGTLYADNDYDSDVMELVTLGSLLNNLSNPLFIKHNNSRFVVDIDNCYFTDNDHDVFDEGNLVLVVMECDGMYNTHIYIKDKYEIKSSDTEVVVARAYLTYKGEYEVRVLQGVPRKEVIDYILKWFPKWAEKYGLTEGYRPLLFSK